MDTCDVLPAHCAHPVGVTSKSPHTQIAGLRPTRILKHVKRGPHQEIYAKRFQLGPEDRADRPSQGRVPGCANRHE